MTKVAIIMGSQSDMPTMQEAARILKKLGVDYQIKVLSAHRTPQQTVSFAKNASRSGVKVIIAGAGGAAHLAGVIAAHTTLPVIGVPMETKYLGGMDSLLSTVQMPGGIPVATMAIGQAGAKNAGILAAQILAVSDKKLTSKLLEYKNELAKSVFVKQAAPTAKLIRINPSRPDKNKIKEAAKALDSGKLVVFPTETVYGIGADAENKVALSRLRRLKQRPTKPFSFHIAEKADLKKLHCAIDKTADKLINKFLPGPITLILKTKRGKKIGVRMPTHPVALALLKKASVWVVAPSANFKAEKPAQTAKEALSDLGNYVDVIVDGGRARIGASSTVLDLTQRPPRLLREGKIKKADIQRLIGKVAG